MGAAPGQPFAVTGFDDYATKLAQHCVVLDAADRQAAASLEAAAMPPAPSRGLELVEDEGLVG